MGLACGRLQSVRRTGLFVLLVAAGARMVRLAGWDGNAERCASIADAFHNLPSLVAALSEGRDMAEDDAALIRALTAEAEASGWSDELQAWQRYAVQPEHSPG